jgi:hypothetical protein
MKQLKHPRSRMVSKGYLVSCINVSFACQKKPKITKYFKIHLPLASALILLVAFSTCNFFLVFFQKLGVCTNVVRVFNFKENI